MAFSLCVSLMTMTFCCLQGLWKIPSNIEYNQASAFAVSYGTAYVGLTNKSNTQPG